MKKQLMATVAVATLGLSSTVSAEEQVKPVDQPNVADTKAEVMKSVTEADVKQSEEQLVKAQENVKHQEQVVAEAEQAKTESETVVTKAEASVTEAEKLVAEATPAIIEATKTDLVAKSQAITEADKTITATQSDLNATKEAVSKQTEVVKAVEAEKEIKDKAVMEAEAGVTKAQAILDGTNSAQVFEEEAQAKQALDTAKAAVTQSEQALLNAKEADQKRAETISVLTKGVTTATGSLTTAQANLDKTQAKADETGTALSQANKVLTEATAKVEAINTITLSTEYVEALTNYSRHYTEKGQEAQAVLKRISADLLANNRFKANPLDDNTVLDTNNLSESVRLELSQFASDLINQIRKAFGTPATVVTPSALELADLTTDGYVADDWSWDKVIEIGHDAKAINNSAKLLGLNTTSPEQEIRGDQYYENMFSAKLSLKTITLSRAKEMIHEAITDFMFNGFEWLHAESIAGLTASGTHYLGVDISTRSNVTGVHVLQVEDDYINAGSTFDKTALVNPYDKVKLLEAYETAKTQQAKASQVDKEAKDNLAKAEQVKVQAETSLATVKAELTKAEQVAIQTPYAQTRLNQAQATLTKATERYTKADQTVKQLSADVKVKQEALNQAQAILSAKMTAKDLVVARLTKEQATLTDLSNLVKSKEVTLNGAKTAKLSLEQELADKKAYLERLENAPKGLETAKQALVNAKDELAKKVVVLEHEVKTLKSLKEKEADQQAQHDKVVKAYQEVLEAKRQAELERQKAELEKAGQIALPVLDDKGQVTGYVAQKEMTSKVTPASLSSVNPTPSHAKSMTKQDLPKTGEASSFFAAIGSIVSGFGLLGLKRRQK